jgi:adenylate cyclase
VGEPTASHSAFVVIHGPGHNGTNLVLREGITSFGRLPANDVILLGDLVSRHHTRITFFEGRATLQDLGSHNGSWVNGERVNTRVLKDGDVCRIGNFRLDFHPGLPSEQHPAGFEETTAAEEARRSGMKAQVLPTAHGSSRPDLDAGSRSAILQQLEQARSGHDQQAKALHLLVRATDALSRSQDLDGYLAAMLGLALEQTGAELVAYLEGGQGPLVVVAARGAKGPLSDPNVATSVVAWVITKNFEVMSDDVAKDLRFPQAAKQAGGKNAVICAPIASGERALGALYAARAKPFVDEDLDAVTAIAHLTSAGIARSRAVSGQAGYASLLAPELRALAQGGPPRPGLEGVNGTLVSVDVPGLGAAAERIDLEVMERAVNAVVSAAGDLAQRHRAWLLPTGGTELRLLFPAGNTPGQDALRGVAGAWDLRAATDPLLQRLPATMPRRVRVGIASGWMLTGIAGHHDRMAYLVMGGTLEAAIALQAAAAPGGILLDQSTYAQVQDHYDARRVQAGPPADALIAYELSGKRASAGRPRSG